MNFEILVSGLVGAVVGAGVTGGFHIWKLRRDELAARCDEVCKAIQQAAELATDYWSKDQSASTAPNVAEARVFGAQTLCDGLYAELRDRFSQNEAAALDVHMSNLLDALTGGDFSVAGRSADAERTRSSMQCASATIIAIRKAHHDTMPLSAHEKRNKEEPEGGEDKERPCGPCNIGHNSLGECWLWDVAVGFQ